MAVLGYKRTARRERDGAKLEKLLITAVLGPIGEIAKCTRSRATRGLARWEVDPANVLFGGCNSPSATRTCAVAAHIVIFKKNTKLMGE